MCPHGTELKKESAQFCVPFVCFLNLLLCIRNLLGKPVKFGTPDILHCLIHLLSSFSLLQSPNDTSQQLLSIIVLNPGTLMSAFVRSTQFLMACFIISFMHILYVLCWLFQCPFYLKQENMFHW